MPNTGSSTERRWTIQVVRDPGIFKPYNAAVEGPELFKNHGPVEVVDAHVADQLADVLRFYQDESNYQEGHFAGQEYIASMPSTEAPIHQDNGKLARAALANYERTDDA